jgi:hypothetical protein
MSIHVSGFLHYFKFKVKLFAATNRRQIELPEFSCEAKRRPVLVQVRDELKAKRPPKIRKADIGMDRLEFEVGVKRKRRAFGDEASERVTIEMIAVRWVSRPVGIGIVRGNDFDGASRSGDAVDLRDKGHHVGHVFDHMTAYDLIKLVGAEGIGQDTQIMNDIGMAARIRVDAYRSGILILTAADIEDSFLRWSLRLFVGIVHESQIER